MIEEIKSAQKIEHNPMDIPCLFESSDGVGCRSLLCSAIENLNK